MSNRPIFSEKVLKIAAGIPKGKVLTYRQVAILAGSPNAYRAVGNILKGNYDEKVFCHRVVRSNGDVGGYNRGKSDKLKKLKGEGILILDNNIIQSK